jgi:hypothetical protein
MYIFISIFDAIIYLIKEILYNNFFIGISQNHTHLYSNMLTKPVNHQITKI